MIRIAAVLALLALAACAAEAPPAPPATGSAEPPADPNPLASLIVHPLRDAQGTPVAVDVLAAGLRPNERMVAARLVAPDGRAVAADPGEIRHGRSLGGAAARPRVGLQGGSDTGVGVTLSLDLFSRRPDQPPVPDGGRAWARIELPPGTEPEDWRVEAEIENAYGDTQTLVRQP